MPPSSIHHRRAHNLLLISKLLNQRDAASPFLLLLDSLEQAAKRLLGEQIRRAKAAKIRIVFVAFETFQAPKNVDIFITAWNQNLQTWQREVTAPLRAEPKQRHLIVFDSLNWLVSTAGHNLPALLSSFISPTTSVVATYHTDIPDAEIVAGAGSAYSPSTLTLLRYFATTVITTHALHHVIAKKAARERSHVEPAFGLEEDVDGVLQGVGANGSDGLVLEMEHRRRSGRGVRQWYFMPCKPADASGTTGSAVFDETIILLEDHPSYAKRQEDVDGEAGGGHADSTFELGLTQKQRLDREGVVLPYFDAQNGGGDGGRILYDMGEDDDFDEEEDEI